VDLDYKVYFHLEFVKMHDSLKHALTISGAKGKDSSVKTELTTFHYRETSTNHSYWVVRSSPGLVGSIPVEKLEVSSDTEDPPRSPGYSPTSPLYGVDVDDSSATTPSRVVTREDIIQTLVGAPKKRSRKRDVREAAKTDPKLSLGSIVVHKPRGFFDAESE